MVRLLFFLNVRLLFFRSLLAQRQQDVASTLVHVSELEARVNQATRDRQQGEAACETLTVALRDAVTCVSREDELRQAFGSHAGEENTQSQNDSNFGISFFFFLL